MITGECALSYETDLSIDKKDKGMGMGIGIDIDNLGGTQKPKSFFLY